MGAAPDDLPRPAGRADDRSQGGRGPRPDAARVARLARCRDHAARHDRRPHGHPLRTRTRPRRQGRPGHEPAEGHRLRDGGRRRAHPRADPRPFGDRRRGAEPPAPARRARRPAHLARGRQGRQPARRGDRQGHRRQGGVPRPRRHAAHADRRCHRCRQVERHQLHHHLAADAHHPRRRAPHPDRPQAGRDGPVRPPAAPAHPAGHQPEEGGQRPRLGGQGDGASLRRALRTRLPRHHRLQQGVRQGPDPAAARHRDSSTSTCRTSWWSSTSSTT